MELFRQASASAASYLSPTERTPYHFEPDARDYTPTDDSTSTLYTPSTSVSTSSLGDSTFTEPYNRNDQDSESETTTIQEESTSSKYDDSFGGQGDHYSSQRDVNYFELRGFEHRPSKTQYDYQYPLSEDTQFKPAESNPQQFYYTYEHARSLPPPFGYNIDY